VAEKDNRSVLLLGLKEGYALSKYHWYCLKYGAYNMQNTIALAHHSIPHTDFLLAVYI
jgi:hypothetical protein